MSVHPRRALPLEAIAESCTCCSTPTEPMPIRGFEAGNNAPPRMSLEISERLSPHEARVASR